MSDAHAFDRWQLRSFHLAGTVAIPSPFPEVGRLSLLPGGLAYHYATADQAFPLVAVEHYQSRRVTITRYVDLRDVAAVRFATCVSPALDSNEGWYFGPEVPRELEARSNTNKPSLAMGIVFVRENAPVLMRVETGMTAAESAEFYPPVPGERSDAHYQLHTGFAWSGCDRKGCDHVGHPR
jgi:hypothetical protein